MPGPKEIGKSDPAASPTDQVAGSTTQGILPAPHVTPDARGLEDDPRWAAIAAAYREHGPRIARRILALTGDPACVDDLLNETFVQAYESMGRFEGRAQLSTWLFGIAINVVRAHLTKRRRRRDLDARYGAPQPQSAPTTEAVVADRQAVDRLYAAVGELPDPLREAFVLCVLEQRSLADAAQELGVPVSTLHARRTRAEDRVRKTIERGSK